MPCLKYFGGGGGGAATNRPKEKLSLVYFEVLSTETSRQSALFMFKYFNRSLWYFSAI